MPRTWTTGPDVELSLYSDDEDVPAIALTGLIDTGASCICMDSRIAKRLSLTASDKRPVQMADGRTEMSTVYTAKLRIPALDFDDYVQVNAVAMTYPSTRVLLGRSFLKDYIVNYDGPRERFEFHETDRGQEFYFDDHDG